MAHTIIADTTKGKRIWIQGLGASNARWAGGTRYTVNYSKDAIHYVRDSVSGKRKVTASKGGIIDTVGKKVTQWAQGATEVQYIITDSVITITRVS